MIMTEQQIVNAYCDMVCKKRTGNKVFPNIFLGTMEADILEITKAGYAYEFEVKLTKSDFKCDSKKTTYFKSKSISKYEYLEGGHRVNYFYYLVPTDLLQSNDVPDFAGLIYFTFVYPKYCSTVGALNKPKIILTTVKKGRLLSDVKFTDARLTKCYESTYYRFHDYRKQQIYDKNRDSHQI